MKFTVKTRLLAVFTLFGVSIVSTAGDAPLVRTFEQKYPIKNIYEREGEVVFAVEDDNSQIQLIPASSLRGKNCYKLRYGVNLAKCLVSCNELDSYLIENKSEFSEIWAYSEAVRNSEEKPFKVFPGGQTKVRLLVAQSTQNPKKTAQSISLDNSKTDHFACTFGTDLNRCFADVGRLILNDDFLVKYAQYLESILLDPELSNNLPKKIFKELNEIEMRATVLSEALNKKGFERFERGGFFFAKNFTNAPALLCQLRSLSVLLADEARLQLNFSALKEGIKENKKELENSIDFISSLP